MDLSINLHPAVVHFPIALLILGSLSGILYLYWRSLPQLHTLMWWPLFIGWIGTTIAILTGLIDQSGLPPQPPYQYILNWHIGTGLGQWVVYGWLFYQRWLYGSQKAQKARAKQGHSYTDILDDPSKRVFITILLILGIICF